MKPVVKTVHEAWEFPSGPDSFGPGRLLVFPVLPLLTFLFHISTAGGLGYFRDELYYLACGEHLDFGYVDHPPLIALISVLVRKVLGESLLAIRLLPAFAAAITVWATSLITREVGGKLFAQALSALAAMPARSLFQYGFQVSFSF